MGASTGVMVRLEESHHPHHHGDVGVSERRRERTDVEVGQILDHEQTRATALLSANRSLLDSLVETLLVRKVLDRAELRAMTERGAHG